MIIESLFEMLLRFTICMFAGLVVLMAAWAFYFRIPTDGDIELVDLRKSLTDKPYYVSFCAGLASNLHGFPGHGFVAWSESVFPDLNLTESAGYCPRFSRDQIASLFFEVPGIVVQKSAVGNLRNLDRLIVIVSKSDFDHTRTVCAQWDDRIFAVGKRDCVRFLNELALYLELNTPDPAYKFPQLYVRELKRLNAGHDRHEEPKYYCVGPIPFSQLRRDGFGRDILLGLRRNSAAPSNSNISTGKMSGTSEKPVRTLR